ncbi:nucleotidyltransferase domain-containing protein [Nocardioides dilutus]
MDLSDPTRAITPTLDGAVLAVLAVAGKPMTVGQVAEKAARGSEIGIRRSLARLVEQGTVRATLMGRNRVHELNREHVAAEAAMILAGLRTELWRRFREELRSWRVRPIYACVFGSAARGDGGASSDIDLMVVHPPFPGEKHPTRRSLGSQVSDALGTALLASAEHDAPERWERDLDRLRERVELWTGNPLQIVDLSFHEWRRPPDSHRALLREVQRDGIELVRARGVTIWPTSESSDG